MNGVGTQRLPLQSLPPLNHFPAARCVPWQLQRTRLDTAGHEQRPRSCWWWLRPRRLQKARSEIEFRKLGQIEKHERWSTRGTAKGWSPGQATVSDESCNCAGERHARGSGRSVRVLRLSHNASIERDPANAGAPGLRGICQESLFGCWRSAGSLRPAALPG